MELPEKQVQVPREEQKQQAPQETIPRMESNVPGTQEGKETSERKTETALQPVEPMPTLATVLSTLKDRLTDVSKKNRSVRLLRLNMRLHFDLHELLEKPEEASLLLEKIRKRKNIRLAPVISSVQEEFKAGYKLNYLQREADFLQKETGNYDVYIGYPFAEGRFRDGTYFKCPLVLFPVTLERDYRRLEFTAKPDPDRVPILNRAFLIAYQKFNSVTFDENIDEEIGEEGNTVDNALAKYKELGIEFESEGLLKQEKIAKFASQRGDPQPRELANRMRIVRNAILGLFPQTSSTLISDYDALRKNPPKEGLLVEFFDEKVEAKVPDTDGHEEAAIVTEVDSSQEKVILASRKTHGLAVYGPPGTGKSQVIVNLIADRVARGEKVLLVCEKRAALDVVYNRFRGIGLSDMAVVVHDYERDRNAVFEKTSRVTNDFINLERMPEGKRFVEDAVEPLQHLTKYHEALHKQLPCGASLHELYANDPDSRLHTIRLNGLQDAFSFEQVKRLRRKLENAASMGEEAAFAGKDFSRFSTADWRKLEEAVSQLQDAYGKWERAVEGSGWRRLELNEKQIFPESMELERQLRALGKNSVLRYADSKYWKGKNWLEAFENENGENDERHQRETRKFLQGGTNFEENKTIAAVQALFDYNRAMEFMRKALKTAREYLGEEAGLGLMSNCARGRKAADELADLRKIVDKKSEVLRQQGWLGELTANERAAFELIKPYAREEGWKKALNVLEHSFYYEWISRAESQAPEIARMDNETYQRKRREAAHAIEDEKQAARAKVKREWLQGIGTLSHSELKVIKFQAEKPTHRWPLRRFASTFVNKGLLKVFPVWLASPETVSALFPLKEGLFDLVVFDEASQCPLEHAMPALYRAKSVVVTGDEKQLPPFDLFEAYLDEGGEEEFERPEVVADAKETESFLQLARKRYPELLLKWHYRSKHAELIAFSNHAFYGGRMAFVPSADEREAKPIEWVAVQGEWEARRNKAEAEKVVELVEQVISRPRPPSVGIITFNVEQKELIESLLEKKARKDVGFYVKYKKEKERMQDEEVQGLFVKNIENVQGDERDVIIFSIGYAPTKAGNIVAQYGSLSIPGGENRLNVAVSRAREKVYLVSSISPLDLRTEESINAGPRLLRKYLEYAEMVSQGKFEHKWLEKLSKERFGDASESFEGEQGSLQRRVADALKEEGLKVTNGSAAPYALDLAVASPKNPHIMIGIECDGKEYSGLQDAKEWDVYRQRFLRRRGWNVYRVSSKQYWENPESVIREIKQVALKAGN